MESEKEKEWNRASLVAHHLTPTVDAMRTDLLTEADAERLAKQRFELIFGVLGYDAVGTEHTTDTPIGVYEPSGVHAWLLEEATIDAALIGVLTEMCREKGISVEFFGVPDLNFPVIDHAGDLRFFSNATPRQIFDALLDALEASND